jgi:hypothetical protein
MTTKKHNKKQTKKAPKRATKKRAVEPVEDLSWLDEAIRQAERRLAEAQAEQSFKEALEAAEGAGSLCYANANHAPRAIGDRVQFKGGTYRESRKPLYHLVPIELMQAVAETRRRGDMKYEPGNWKKGDRVFFVDCLNHCIEHLYNVTESETLEGAGEALGHAATNIGFMLWAMRRGLVTRRDFEQAAVLERGAA